MLLLNKLIKFQLFILCNLLWTLTLSGCSKSNTVENEPTSDLPEFASLKIVLGYKTQETVIPTMVEDEEILRSLGYKGFGIIGDYHFDTFMPGDGGYVGWVIRKNSDSSLSTGVGTLTRDPSSGKCKVLTTRHLAVPLGETQKEADVIYRFVRPKPGGFGRPIELFFDETIAKHVDMPVFMEASVEVDNCIEIDELSYRNLSKENYQSVTSLFSDIELVAVSPARGTKFPYYAVQTTKKFSLLNLYVGSLRSNLESFQGMSGSPIMIKNPNTNDYKILGLFSGASLIDCEEFKALRCQSFAIMMSKNNTSQE